MQRVGAAVRRPRLFSVFCGIPVILLAVSMPGCTRRAGQPKAALSEPSDIRVEVTRTKCLAGVDFTWGEGLGNVSQGSSCCRCG